MFLNSTEKEKARERKSGDKVKSVLVTESAQSESSKGNIYGDSVVSAEGGRKERKSPSADDQGKVLVRAQCLSAVRRRRRRLLCV